MGIKAAIFLIVFCQSFIATSVRASQLDSDLADAVQKKDWPSVVLLQDPHKGQNFEHDLVLAKALLSLERRIEAQKLLVDLQDERKDERVDKLIQSAGTLFFAQETSTLYYEALDLIRGLKFPEAKEHLEQGLAKEPGQAWMLSRLVQMQLALGQGDAASASLTLARATGLNLPELKVYAAKLAVDKKLRHKVDEEESADSLLRIVSPVKTLLLDNEVTETFWCEALKRAEKEADLESLAEKTLKDHPLWSYSLMWFYEDGSVAPATKQKLRAQLEKNLKTRESFDAALALEMKRTDYFWSGYSSFESLTERFRAAVAKPSPTPN